MAKFKAHKMYSKDRIVKMAKTMKEHLDLKEKGFNHDSRRESSPAKMASPLYQATDEKQSLQTKYRKFKAQAGSKIRKLLGEPEPAIRNPKDYNPPVKPLKKTKPSPVKIAPALIAKIAPLVIGEVTKKR